jgi:[acyl-carrier-protein] S-malonyltransferase
MTVGLVFSPQGSQHVGMGRALVDASPAAAAVFANADSILGWSVSDLCWTGPDERLTDTRFAQPALLTSSIAALEALRERTAAARTTVSPTLVAGHSAGEYAALVAAGAVSLADALSLVSLRGQLMAEAAVDGGMTAVIGLDRDALATALSDPAVAEVVIANDNAPGQIVISGPRAALAAAEQRALAAGARRVIRLRVSGPFHSPSMAAVGDALSAAFGEVAWNDAEPPVVSNVTGMAVRDAGDLRGLLARQVSSPVEWVRVVEFMVAAGVDTFIECGSGSALVGMIRRIAPSVRAIAVTDPASLEIAASAVAGQPVPA